MIWKRYRESVWLEMTTLVVISALVYLVRLGNLSYYRDDWYYMYDGLVGGGKIFREMFLHLRPARGPLFNGLFDLFGTNPQPYLFLLYLWRVLGGMGALWLFRILWLRERRAAFWMALLYLLYPGFLWWVQGFEYQPMVLSATLQIFSIVFTLKATQSQSRYWYASWIILSLITGWAALAFVEYSIGMEALRWLCVYILLKREGWGLRQTLLRVIRVAYISLLIPFGFLVWHQFIFSNARKAADLGLQMGTLLSSPSTGLWWLVHSFQSVLNVVFFAWVLPFAQLFFNLRLRDTLIAITIMGVVLTFVFVVNRSLTASNGQAQHQVSPASWQLEAIFLGLAGTVAGVLPIIVVNRVVTLERFSHYALPASLAAVVFLTGLLNLLVDKRIRLAVSLVFVGLSVLTHSALASHARSEEAQVQVFWHQVTWRIPHIKSGTVLLVNYTGMDYREGNDIVWGPANFIYYPVSQDQIPIVVALAAARLEPDTPKNILEGARLNQNYIVVNEMQYDFNNLLVLTMPSENSCIHVLDRNWAEVSVADPALIALSASKSSIDLILPDGEAPSPAQDVFGKEPAHEWCYYYQKAQLARQLEDWEEIMKINEQVTKLGLHPNDQIEWMPFLQAAATTEDLKLVKQISTRINTEQLYKKQACQNLKAMHLAPAIQKQAVDLFCGGRTN